MSEMTERYMSFSRNPNFLIKIGDQMSHPNMAKASLVGHLEMLQWSEHRGVHLHFIEPGRPSQSNFVASFNGTFGDECLNENGFYGMQDAREEIETWRVDYNTQRPHRSLRQLTPFEYKEKTGNNPTIKRPELSEMSA